MYVLRYKQHPKTHIVTNCMQQIVSRKKICWWVSDHLQWVIFVRFRWTQFEHSVQQQFCPSIVVISSGIRLCNDTTFWLHHEPLSFSKYKGQDWDKVLKIRTHKTSDMAPTFGYPHPKEQGEKAKQWKAKHTKKTTQECTRLKKWISYTLPSRSLVDQNFDETGSHEFVAGAVE